MKAIYWVISWVCFYLGDWVSYLPPTFVIWMYDWLMRMSVTAQDKAGAMNATENWPWVKRG